MAGKFSQFYFTKEDPDYSIKGSRDPLGFQVLWQHQGRKLIPYLSTVSMNLQDFQILCLAYYLYGTEPDNHFVRFFLRFEQLMAYTRFNPSNTNEGFNGVDKVRKKLNESNRISISNSVEDDILSNQRAYGIWGKYNRPFQDINFTKHESFIPIFSEKIEQLQEKADALKIISKIINNRTTASRFDILELSCLKPLLDFTKREKIFYTDLILKVNGANPFQNELFHFVSKNQLPSTFDLYPFLKSFGKTLGISNENLKNLLNEIAYTEKILSPLNHIFRYLQTKPLWLKQELIKDHYIKNCKHNLKYGFLGGTEDCKIKNQLIQTLNKDNWGLVEDLVSRNREVSEWREGAPWVSINKDSLEVYHAEGGFQDPDYNPDVNFDNGYFIDTYIRLYRQIKGNR